MKWFVIVVAAMLVMMACGPPAPIADRDYQAKIIESYAAGVEQPGIAPDVGQEDHAIVEPADAADSQSEIAMTSTAKERMVRLLWRSVLRC